MRVRMLSAGFAAALVCGLPGLGQTLTSAKDPEDFKVEITGSAWILNSAGRIQANGTPIDLVSDLNVQQRQTTFFGQLVIKPGRKHRIIVEGMPVQLSGLNTVSRTVVFRGQTFTVNQTLQSSADLTYVFGGYQYDLVSGPRGHFGLSAGGAYVNASGTIRSVQTGVVASTSQTIGLPLAGAEFRLFPIPGHKILEVDGGLRGMGFGDYGHYVEAIGNGGVCIGPVCFLAGYRAVNADLHGTTSSQSGISTRLKAPIFSLLAHW